jgi:hypothetical protein
MDKLLAKLPAFALPFVTRSLRGGRGRRYVLFSLMIAAATALIGFWLALGSGTFEQEVRVDLRLEQNEWDRQLTEFVVFTHSSFQHDYALQDAAQLRHRGAVAAQGESYSEVAMVSARGLELAQEAVNAESFVAPADRALYERAYQLVGGPTSSSFFRWSDPAARATLRRIVDLEAVPEVRRYQSPLGVSDSLKIIGFLAGLALAACATVFGPLLVALQQAQERHENTLMPLTGTAMSPRELALGLAAGPLAVVAIFAAPQLVMFGVCALLVGHMLSAVALLAALAATGLFLTFASQLLGQLVGQRRTPGVVAIALMGVLGVAWLSGVAFLTERDPAIGGMAAVLPTIGLSGLLAFTFGEFSMRGFETLLVATLAWSMAALVFAGLTATALARKIESRPGALLNPRAALLGALTCIALIHVALRPADEEGLLLFLGLAALALPFSLLLMARVPIGDDPPRMRRIPVPKLLAEFASWWVAHIVLAYLLSNTPERALHPVSMLYLGWCVVVLGMMAIRLVAIPARVLDHLFLGFCGVSLIVGFAQALYWALERAPSIEYLFALSKLSPVLGLVQVLVTIAVPIVLARSLSKNLGSIA